MYVQRGNYSLCLLNLSLAPSACYPGLVGFNTSVETVVNSVSYLTGTPTVCVNGSGLPICNGTSLDRYVLFSVCQQSTGGSLISKSEQSVACHISLTRQGSSSSNSILFDSID